MILDVLADEIPNHRDGFTTLICKHILGETSERENRRMENWLAKSEANRDRYNEIKLILDSLRDAKCPYDFNINAAWTRFKSRLERRAGK
jgi:ferric-dicitrate binding protein FerR (iron transport regulator)